MHTSQPSHVPHRRLETVDAAVEREALAQACAFAEAALEGERTARLAAEQELGLLAAAAEVGNCSSYLLSHQTSAIPCPAVHSGCS